jgi:pSer/pThr/pTyr-binding forkhead associated (FHA) protein
MNSTNGTYVDGGRINAVLVNAEAELSLGGYRVKLRPG